MSTNILLALDDSAHAARATEWCAAHAAAVGADVVVVHAIDPAYVFGTGSPVLLVPPMLNAEQIEELRDVVTREWCKPLADAGVAYRVVLVQERPATAVMATAREVHADLVVCGRRGRGGVAEMLLGSTSHELSHHLGLPLVIVP